MIIVNKNIGDMTESELKDFKKFLNDSGFFEFNEGHANAFGSSIKRNKIFSAINIT